MCFLSSWLLLLYTSTSDWCNVSFVSFMVIIWLWCQKFAYLIEQSFFYYCSSSMLLFQNKIIFKLFNFVIMLSLITCIMLWTIPLHTHILLVLTIHYFLKNWALVCNSCAFKISYHQTEGPKFKCQTKW